MSRKSTKSKLPDKRPKKRKPPVVGTDREQVADKQEATSDANSGPDRQSAERPRLRPAKKRPWLLVSLLAVFIVWLVILIYLAIRVVG